MDSVGGMGPNGNSEDLLTLEAEITELQRENARVESQMLRLKSDITAMETQLNHGEKVSCTPTQTTLETPKTISETPGKPRDRAEEQQPERVLRKPEE